jgi:tyrosyl-tRNA synthetase
MSAIPLHKQDFDCEAVFSSGSDPMPEQINLPTELEEQFAELIRGTEEVLPRNELRKKLLKSTNSGKPLIIKAGFDPTAPDLHLGHTVLIQKLYTFQRFGHEVHFLIGDYTALIGDPTGKSETRKPLSTEEVLKNAQTYKEQVFKILDPKKTKVVFNSSWLEKLNLKDILKLTSHTTVARLLERDDFSKRYSTQQSISLVEFLYPLMQGYDSVAMDSDIELGGTDQKFNLLVGRDLQGAYQQSQQVILTMPLLVGLDGTKKMSKSLGNYVGIQEVPLEIFGKLMSLSDELMWSYYNLLSTKTIKEIEILKGEVATGKLHPKEAKSKLAKEICARYYDIETAENAAEEWSTIHSASQKGLPKDIETYVCKTTDRNREGSIGILDLLRLSGLSASNSDARRLVQGGGATIIYDEDNEEKKVSDTSLVINSPGFVLKAGKRKFKRITFD